MYQVNILMFTHVHYINGVIVTHSHPIQGEHTHTSAECVYFNHLSSLQSFEPPVLLTLLQPDLLCSLLDKEKVTPLWKGVCVQIPSLRAPPFLV